MIEAYLSNSLQILFSSILSESCCVQTFNLITVLKHSKVTWYTLLTVNRAAFANNEGAIQGSHNSEAHSQNCTTSLQNSPLGTRFVLNVRNTGKGPLRMFEPLVFFFSVSNIHGTK